MQHQIEYQGETVPLESMPCFTLSHTASIESVHMRETHQRHPMVKAPNTILTVDREHMLRVY